MNRLTKSELTNGFPVCYPKSDSGLPILVTKTNPYVEIVEKLKEYEDLEEQGKLIKLPCAVGDTVYCVDPYCKGNNWQCNYRPYHCKNCSLKQNSVNRRKFSLDMVGKFGKTVFLTEEEAKTALKKESEQE